MAPLPPSFKEPGVVAQTTIKSQHSRSSFSLRGRRKSSFGDMSTVLHPDIQSFDFCRHVSPDLPDPVRLRQLLIYAVQRDLNTQNSDLLAASAGKIVMKQVLKRLAQKKINTSWYHRERESLPLVTLPNPQNARYVQEIRNYTAVINKYTKEEQEWKAEVKNVNQVSKQLRKDIQQLVSQPPVTVSTMKLSNEQGRHRWRQALSQSGEGTQMQYLKSDRQQLQSLAETREKLQALVDAMHRVKIYAHVEQRMVDTKFAIMIDACWPQADEIVKEDSDTSMPPQTPRRSKAMVLHMASTPISCMRDTQTVSNVSFTPRDKTMKILRTLSTALATKPPMNRNISQSSSSEE